MTASQMGLDLRRGKGIVEVQNELKVQEAERLNQQLGSYAIVGPLQADKWTQ